MSQIGTDFLETQADLFLPITRHEPTSLDELDGKVAPHSGAAFMLRHIRETGARRVLAIGCGTGMIELGIAQAVPDVRFELVEPSAAQLAHFERRLAESAVDPGRFTVFRGYFRDYIASEFDLIVSIHAWYYAHSADELGRAMAALRPGGRFLLQLWAHGSFVWRLCTDLGAAGKSRLGHLLSAEEVRACAEELGYRVSTEYFNYEDDVDERGRVEELIEALRQAVARGPEAEALFWQALWASKGGKDYLDALAYFSGVPVADIDHKRRVEAWSWFLKNFDAGRRCGRLVVTAP